MNQVLIKLQSQHVNVEEAVSQLGGNEEIYLKILKKFIEDDNLEKLIKSVEKEDNDNAFLAAHTLKGVYSGLYFLKEYELCSEIVEMLRKKNVSNIELKVVELNEMHQKKINILKKV